MDNFEWRYSARVLAYVDLIMAVASVALFAFLTVKALILFLRIKIHTFIAWAKLFGFVIADIKAGLHLWAALELFSATEVGEAVGEALAKSRIWCNVNVFFVVLAAILQVIHICRSFNSRGTEATAILIILRIISSVICFLCMFIVSKFIEELEMVATSGGSAS